MACDYSSELKKPSAEKVKCLQGQKQSSWHRNLNLDNYDMDEWESTQTTQNVVELLMIHEI